MTRRPRLAALATLLLVSSSLSGCQLLGGEDDTLAEALDLVPATVTEAEFVNRSVLAERVGLADLTTPAGAAEIRKYRRATDLYLAPPSGLNPYLETMQAVAFSELDVEWAVHAPVPGGDGPTDIYRVADDVDLDRVVDDLVRAGFDREEVDGRSRLAAESLRAKAETVGSIAGGYPVEFSYGLIVAPEEHLVIATSAVDTLTAVLDDEADSLADAGTFDGVVDDVEDVEYAFVQRDLACGGSSEEQQEELGITDLGDVTRRGLFASTDDRTLTLSARLQFDDDAAAEDDLEARTEYLETRAGTSTGDPGAELPAAELDRHGDVVRMELDLEPTYDVLEMWFAYDAYFECNG